MNRVGQHVTTWERETETNWRSGCSFLLIVAVLAFIVGMIVGMNTTTRTTQVTSPQPAASGATDSVSASAQATTTTSPESSPTSLASVRRSLAPTPRPTPKKVARDVLSGLASYCAPTPRYCRGWGGTARLAAVPTFHYGDRPYQVIVRSSTGSVVVTVVSFCACGNKIIDLSPYAFQKLAPLYRGVVKVTVTR